VAAGETLELKRAVVLLVVLAAGCRRPGLEGWEERFAEYRALRDQRELLEHRGLARAEDGRTAAELRTQEDALRAELAAQSPRVHIEEERRALGVMREGLARPRTDATSSGDLREETFAAFGAAAATIPVEGEVLDRLTILGRLGRESDPQKRRRLFMALAPVWSAVDGDGRRSPYRMLAARDTDSWRPGHAPVERAAKALEVPPAELERVLVRVLERWRDTSAVPGEPWDYWYAAGEASRVLGPRVPRERLRAVNDVYHRDLGADPAALGVAYDLDPREGKSPVAFTTFAARRPVPRAVVFATYREGGFDNLVELLHETGHAVHISAIRTRPAFTDWPDSDTFTEALGDLLALEAYEPAWQERYLGAKASGEASRRAKYAAVMLDICWALLEWRVHRDPGADPNAVWTELTSRYLKVTPHPELSWWAIRGQLVSDPGYMMNYALGALLAADLRARQLELRGPLGPDPTRYPWLSEQLYRFGREKDARQVVRSFLGRTLRADALLADLAPNAGGTAAARPRPGGK
jgi:hypothetical protein